MNEKEMRKFLDENSEAIQEKIRTRMVESIAESCRWNIPDVVQKTINEFMEAEIVPAVREHLTSQKGPIVEAAIIATSQITDNLAEKMLEKAMENMNGYRFKSIINSIFE